MAVKVGSILVAGLFSASLRVLLSQDPPDDSCLENDEVYSLHISSSLDKLHDQRLQYFIDSGLVMYSEDVLDICSC